MAAPSLQRSSVSFRRQGSSGLVWDDLLFSGELARPTKPEIEPEKDVPMPADESRVGGTVVPSEKRKMNKKKRTKSRPEPVAVDGRRPAAKRTSCGCCGILVSPRRPASKVMMTKR